MSTTTVSSPWTLNVATWPPTPNLCGPKTTRTSQTPPAWPQRPREPSEMATFLTLRLFERPSHLSCHECCVSSAGLKLFSIVPGRRTLEFTHVLSLTLTVLHPATLSLRKVSLKIERKEDFSYYMMCCFSHLESWISSCFLFRVKEAAGDQSWPQIPQWVLHMVFLLYLVVCHELDWLSNYFFITFFTPVIPLKSDLAVELLEKGRVRFWLQAEKMSNNGKVDYVFNDNVVSQGEVSENLRSDILLVCSTCVLK